MIAPDDRGLTLGDGLFETVLARDGVLADWDAHMARLIRGCLALGLPAPDAGAVFAAAGEALAGAGLAAGRAALRIAWTAGSGGRGVERPQTLVPTLIVTAAAAPASPGPVRLATSAIRRNETSPTARHKTLNYLDNVMARREAAAAGADDALMLNSLGEVACASVANLFWMSGGVLFTPALECGALAGTIRARVIEAAMGAGDDVREVRAGADVLKNADAIFLTNSLVEVRDVASLDGQVLPQQVGQVIVATLRGRR